LKKLLFKLQIRLVMILLSLLLVGGQSEIQPAFFEATCDVPSAHNPLVLSGVEFSMGCATRMDFGSSLLGMQVTITSSLDGLIFNGTMNSSRIK